MFSALPPDTDRYADILYRQFGVPKQGSEGLIVQPLFVGHRGKLAELAPYQATRVLGWLADDVVITPEEIRGLMEERL